MRVALALLTHRLQVPSPTLVVNEARYVPNMSGVDVEPEPAIAGGQQDSRDLHRVTR